MPPPRFLVERSDMDTERDPEAWLIERVRDGWSQYDIERALKPHHRITQPTIGRNIRRLRLGQGITKRMRGAVLAHFVYEAEQDARVEADQAAFLELMDALEEWQAFNAYEAEQALIAQERRVAAENALRSRQEKVRTRARIVNQQMQDLGIVEKGNTYVYGDGAALISEGAAHFRYHNTEAEIISYSPGEARLPDGRTVAQLREGVTRERRMRPSAVPAGQTRPETIGIRRANHIPYTAYFDGRWFWGHLYADIAAWYELRDAAPAWWESGRERPPESGDDDITWYGRALELEVKLLESGLAFEESVLGWGDDWTDEADERRAALRDMERRRVRSEATAARKRAALKLARWGIVATVALGLLLFVVIPIVLWALRGILAGIRALAGAVVAFGEWMGHAVLAAAASPVTFLVLAFITLLLVVILPSDRRGQDIPAFPWVLGAATAFGVLTAIAGLMWASHLLLLLLVW